MFLHKIFVILFLVPKQSYSSSSETTSLAPFWTISNLFSKCDLVFITGYNTTISENFQSIRNNNKYSPIQLIVPSYTTSSFSRHKIKNNQTRQIISVRRCRIKFLYINGLSLPKETHKEILAVALKNYSGFVFIVLLNSQKINNYNQFRHRSISSKVILYKDIAPNALLIVCIPCKRFVKFEIFSNNLTMNILHDTWTTLNNNDMQGMVVLADERSIIYQTAICGLHVYQWGIKDTHGVCSLLKIRDKYNVSLQYREDKRIRSVAISYIYYDLTLTTDLYSNSLEQNRLKVVWLEWRIFSFVIVINTPKPMDSLSAFISPFDTPTWISLIVSCAGIIIVLQVCRNSDNNLTKFLKGVSYDSFRVVCFLLGQVNGNIETVFRIRGKSGVSAVMLVIGWFFGAYILMSNLYGGSLFSAFVVPQIPPVPTNFEELVHSNLTVLTNTFGTLRQDNTFFSTVKEFIIPQLLEGLQNNAKFTQLLTHFNSNLVFVPRPGRIISMALNIAKSMKIGDDNESFETNNTFAILNKPSDLALTTEFIPLMDKHRNKYIIGRSGYETPFNIARVLLVYSNFFAPVFSKIISQLVQSGLYDRWLRIERIKAQLLHVAVQGDKKMDSEFFGKKMAGWKESPHNLQNENESQPVSLKVLENIFVIFGLIGGFILVEFVIEMLSDREVRAEIFRWSVFCIKYIREWSYMFKLKLLRRCRRRVGVVKGVNVKM